MNAMMTGILFILCVAQGGARGQNEVRPARAPAADVAAGKADAGDIASQLNEVSEARRVILSTRMYFAIKSVEVYRNTVQKAALSASERKWSNFDIMIMPGSKSSWLQPAEKKTHFEVTLMPRRESGDPIALDTPSSLGRLACYAVRISDYEVTRVDVE
jgi:hypothetical protein